MLESVDVLIGLIVVLLALSMTVTVITQALTAIVNSRGLHLRRGLVDLLQLLDPAFDKTKARAVASQILRHSLVSGSSVFGGLLKPRLGNVVHREEFIKLLIGLALDQRGDGAPQDTDGKGQDASPRDQGDREAREAVKAALRSHDVDPAATLLAIRSVALQFERTAPELSSMARQNAAILAAAPNDFVAKIHNWFDQTMDRTSQRFTASTRVITFAGAFLVAFGLQVDTPSLVNRLAADDAMRAAFVEQGKAMSSGGATSQPNPSAGTTPPAQKPVTTAPDPNAQKEREYRAFLAANGIIKLPTSDDWGEGFTLGSVFGMLITALLLSVGAPFWYGALSQLLRLRSVLAGKDDAQRAERQLTTGSSAAAGPR